MDQQAMVEYRYRAVREVLGGSPVGEVAVPAITGISLVSITESS